MARNSTLLSLLQDYRAEAHLSGNPAHNSAARDGQVTKLQQTQAWLWEKHDWPHLRVRRYIDLQAGQRYYDPLAAKANIDSDPLNWSSPNDLTIDRLEKIEVRYGGEWCSLHTGIGDGHYTAWDSDLDERTWPVERWQIHEGETVEIWPIPADDTAADWEGRLRLTGVRSLRPLVADDDRADLDNRLIVLFAASDHLAGSGGEDAQLILDKAKDMERRLTANLSKKPSFGLFQNAPEPGRQLRGMPRVHYRVT